MVGSVSYYTLILIRHLIVYLILIPPLPPFLPPFLSPLLLPDTPTGQRMVCTETMTDVLRSRGRQTCTSTDGATATSITRTFTQKRNADGSYTLYVSSTPINPDQPVANDVYPSRLLPVLSPSNIVC